MPNVEWDARPELMGEILASIAPVETDAALRDMLARHYPRDCSNLPISGGWGYSESDAIVFVRCLFPIPAIAKFVPLEYHIVQKILYEELIVFRPKNYRFSGITKSLKVQHLVKRDDKIYDRLQFLVSCWTDWHWEQLKQEWESNAFGMAPGFDRTAHTAKREAAQVRYDREFWFDISDVFAPASSEAYAN